MASEMQGNLHNLGYGYFVVKTAMLSPFLAQKWPQSQKKNSVQLDLNWKASFDQKADERVNNFGVLLLWAPLF